MSDQDMDLSQLSKPAIIAELMTIKTELARARLDLSGSQLVSAARFDCLALVAAAMNRPDIEVKFSVPDGAAERKVMTEEIRGLVGHLRERPS